MQLYSITYDQLTLVSVFDEKGKKIADREERVRVSMHDLPLSTACMYRDKMTGLNFEMRAQTPGQSEQPRSYKRDHRREDAKVNSARAAARPSQPSKQQINQAAASGDLTAAINNRSK